jgi:hypothetical protein
MALVTLFGLCLFVDGGWTSWINITGCVGTCGSGNQTSSRNCTNPAQCNGGQYCKPENTAQVLNTTGIQIEMKSSPCSLPPCSSNGSVCKFYYY